MGANTPPGSKSAIEQIRLLYSQFATQQQNKLQMIRFLIDKQAEIDDPMTVVRAVLTERHSHLDERDVDRVLELIYSTSLPDLDKTEFEELISRCTDILGEYAFEAFMIYMEHERGSLGPTDDHLASIFTALIADFEAFVVNFLTAIYSARPEVLASGGKTVPWSVLVTADSIEAVRDELIDSAVVDVMRGPFKDWMSTLKSDFAIPVEKYCSEPAVAERFQRRNVIVHNGGLASRLYIKNCPDFHVEHGAQLPITKEYLRETADELAVIALAIAVGGMIHLAKGDQDVEKLANRQMGDWVYELLLRRRYVAVDHYLVHAPISRLADRQTEEICRVNHWVALYRMGRGSECAAEVEQWQVDHLGGQYQLAKMVLTGEMETAARLAADLRRSGELPTKHWLQWPLLESVREHVQQSKSHSDSDDA